MASPRQTVSYLTRRFNEVGLIPDTRHGQNFLVDLNLVELLVRSADIQPDDLVLEVGTGTGSLTAMLAARAGEVITVEIDAHLYQLAAESLVEFSNITMLHQDALRNKNNLHADLLTTIRERLNASDGTAKRFKLVANLPFNIATPIVSNLLLTDVVPTSMTITIQKELADRMTACPGTKDYNALSIWMQALCDTEIIRVLPPSVFWPRPKVDSAIVQIVHNEDKRARIPDVDFFHSFVRSMFLHRRKFLRGVLISTLKGKLDKPAVDEIMAKMQFGADSRAEQLEIPQMIALCEIVREKVNVKER